MRSSRSRTAAAAAITNTAKSIAYPPNCRPISEDLPAIDLTKRLKDIAQAFQLMNQDDDNTKYKPLAILLTQDFYLDHNSRDIRLVVACALADVFRVFANSIPYQGEALIQRIFRFFIEQLKELKDPKNPIFNRYFYLLEELAVGKAFNHCRDLEDAQEVFCDLFQLLFTIVNENHNERVKKNMADLLASVVLNADTLSPDLMEIIFYQLVEPRKSSASHANLLAREVVRKSISNLSPFMLNYLAIAVTSDSANNDQAMLTNSHRSHNAQISEHFRKNIGSICDLIYELNVVVPLIMQEFLPQLEYKIKSNDEKERCEFTKLSARLFSDKGSTLATSLPELWKCFLGRFKDISATVRVRCAQYSMHFLMNHPEMKEDIAEQLKQRQHDQDENVRHEVVMAIVSCAKKSLDNISEELLRIVEERTLDKKFKIRREALYGLAQLYRQHILNIRPEGPAPTTSDGTEASKRLPWIKNKCLHNYYQANLEDKLLVERIVHTCLVPCSMPLEDRMRTLYAFYVTLDAHAARAFNEMLKQQQMVRGIVCDILDIVEQPQEDKNEALLTQKVQICSRCLLDSSKAEEQILHFIENLEGNKSLRNHLGIIVRSTLRTSGRTGPPPPCAVIEKSAREVLRSLGLPTQANLLYMTIKNLMERVAPIMIDREGITKLLDFVSDSLIGDGQKDTEMGIAYSVARGLQLVLNLAYAFPALFCDKELYTKFLLPFLWYDDADANVAEAVLQILTVVGRGSRDDNSDSEESNDMPLWAEDSDVIPKIIETCVEKASSPKQVKYAIQCLTSVLTDEDRTNEIFATILDSIESTGLSLKSDQFKINIVALGMIAATGAQKSYSARLKTIITKHIIQDLIMKDARKRAKIDSQEQSDMSQSVREQSSFELSFDRCSEEVKCKIEGIKLIVRWILGMKIDIVTRQLGAEAVNRYTKTVQNTLQMCKTILENSGDLNGENLAGTTNEKSHLRLAAAKAILYIVSNDTLTIDQRRKSSHTGGDERVAKHLIRSPAAVSTLISPPQLNTLATTLIDPQEFVREKFALKLHKRLLSLELGLEFLAIFSLGGYFPSDNLFYKKIQTYLISNFAKRRELIKTNSAYAQILHPDCTMPFVIHLLSNMPFYKTHKEPEQLETAKDCIWFIMEQLVHKNENFSLTFFKKTFESIKTCIDKVTAPQDGRQLDANAEQINYKIYCACDLAIALLMSKTHNIASREPSLKPQLHSKYYTRSEHFVENNHKCYLPEAMQFPPPKKCSSELAESNKRFKRA